MAGKNSRTDEEWDAFFRTYEDLRRTGNLLIENGVVRAKNLAKKDPRRGVYNVVQGWNKKGGPGPIGMPTIYRERLIRHGVLSAAGQAERPHPESASVRLVGRQWADVIDRAVDFVRTRRLVRDDLNQRVDDPVFGPVGLMRRLRGIRAGEVGSDDELLQIRHHGLDLFIPQQGPWRQRYVDLATFAPPGSYLSEQTQAMVADYRSGLASAATLTTTAEQFSGLTITEDSQFQRASAPGSSSTSSMPPPSGFPPFAPPRGYPPLAPPSGAPPFVPPRGVPPFAPPSGVPPFVPPSGFSQPSHFPPRPQQYAFMPHPQQFAFPAHQQSFDDQPFPGHHGSGQPYEQGGPSPQVRPEEHFYDHHGPHDQDFGDIYDVSDDEREPVPVAENDVPPRMSRSHSTASSPWVSTPAGWEQGPGAPSPSGPGGTPVPSTPAYPVHRSPFTPANLGSPAPSDARWSTTPSQAASPWYQPSAPSPYGGHDAPGPSGPFDNLPSPQAFSPRSTTSEYGGPPAAPWGAPAAPWGAPAAPWGAPAAPWGAPSAATPPSTAGSTPFGHHNAYRRQAASLPQAPGEHHATPAGHRTRPRTDSISEGPARSKRGRRG
jgi:hypothetical protein